MTTKMKMKTTTTNLFVDRVALSEYDVTAEQPREKGVMRTRLAAVQLPLKEEERLVERDEFREVRRVLPRRARDGLEPRAPTFGLRLSSLLLLLLYVEEVGMCRWSASGAKGETERERERERTALETYPPRPNKMAMINAWGNLTLTPYTKPFRAPLRMAR